jgi:hypothetical protein
LNEKERKNRNLTARKPKENNIPKRQQQKLRTSDAMPGKIKKIGYETSFGLKSNISDE